MRQPGRAERESRSLLATAIAACLTVLACLWSAAVLTPAAQARTFGAFTADIQPAEVFPGADRFGPLEGTPPAVAAWQGDRLVGYVFGTSDIGYSGKPIRLLAGMNVDGVIVGAKVIEHHEPILLIGIPEEKLFAFVDKYVGRNIIETARTSAGKPPADVISGATVTIIVIHDGLMRTAVKVARSRGIAGFKAATGTAAAAPAETVTLAEPPFETRDWVSLTGDGSVRRLNLSNADVNEAFAKIGVGSPEPFGKAGEPQDTFIDLYAALLTPERIGRNLLGDAEYANLKGWLKPGQAAVLLVANGDYSYRGSGFVRGGIFDRFQIIQGEAGILLNDKHYRRLGSLAPGMPEFAEIGLFKIPESAEFDPTRPWRVELLAARPTGPIEKSFTSFSLPYEIPEAFLKRTPAPRPAPAPALAPATPVADTGAFEDGDDAREPLWVQIWRSRVLDIVILSVSLAILTLIFFFQDVLVRHPRLLDRLRLAFLTFTVVWIGGYAGAQLSVVNVLTFTNALVTGFRWEFFLLEPLIFILWCATAVSLLFWGRGPFCGWLCPVGALQELLARLARALGIRPITVPWGLHERLWPIKYIVFLILLGLSLNSMATAERFAEVETFKTIVLLHFMRDGPFVVWAMATLAVGLFIERAYCRYLCPLGAALAIPGRIRLFEWLKRRRQCGVECSLCARNCMVQAIHPLGLINPNECLYCLDCQVTYWDDQRCPPLILRRTKREKRVEMGARHEAEKHLAETTTTTAEAVVRPPGAR